MNNYEKAKAIIQQRQIDENWLFYQHENQDGSDSPIYINEPISLINSPTTFQIGLDRAYKEGAWYIDKNGLPVVSV